MNEIMEKEMISIDDMIYEVRGVQVMLDSDLAKLYQVETKRINEAVKNNPDKFPERYLIKITEYEYQVLKSKISTSKGGSRKGHTAFTEQGVYMLATILKSNVETKVSVAIMDAFVLMKKYISNDFDRISNIEKNIVDIHNTLSNHEENFRILNESFKKFDEKRKANDIYFAGQVFYHCGTSVNGIGKRTFSINVLQDSSVCKALMKDIILLNKLTTCNELFFLSYLLIEVI